MVAISFVSVFTKTEFINVYSDAEEFLDSMYPNDTARCMKRFLSRDRNFNRNITYQAVYHTDVRQVMQPFLEAAEKECISYRDIYLTNIAIFLLVLLVVASFIYVIKEVARSTGRKSSVSIEQTASLNATTVI